MLITTRTPQARANRLTPSSNPKLALALAAVPGIADTTTLTKALVVAARDIPLPLTTEDVDGQVLDALAAGTLPPDLPALYANALAAAAAYDLCKAQLTTMFDHLNSQRAEQVLGGFAAMCRALDTDLQRLWPELSQLLTNGTPVTAEEAVGSGNVDAYLARIDLLKEYRQIRAAHRAILEVYLDAGNGEGLRETWDIVGMAPRLALECPDLPELLRYGSKADQSGREVRVRAPWPDPSTDEFVGWLAAHPTVGVWAPTFDDAQALRDELRRAVKFTELRRYQSLEIEKVYADRAATFSKHGHTTPATQENR